MEVAGKDNHSLHSLIPKKSTHSFHFCLAKDKNDIITVIRLHLFLKIMKIIDEFNEINC